MEAHLAAARRELEAWSEQPERAGTADPAGLVSAQSVSWFRARRCGRRACAPLAERVSAAGHDRAVDAALCLFFNLPSEHREFLSDQERSVPPIEPLGDECVRYARTRHDVIARLGRFPHRNPAPGRATIREEQAFLDAGGIAA